MAQSAGWRDFVGMIEHYKKQLEDTLLKGKFGPKRPNDATDDEVRAMLFMCERIEGIPAAVATHYDFVRQQQEARQRIIDSHTMPTGADGAFEVTR